MGFLDIITSVDLLGFTPAFTFKGNKTYKSTLGAVLSIVAFMISLSSVLPNFQSWLYKSNPSILREVTKNEDPIPLASVSNKLMMMFSKMNFPDLTSSDWLNAWDFKDFTPYITYISTKSNTLNQSQSIKFSTCDTDYISDIDMDVSYRSFCLPVELSYEIFQQGIVYKLPLLVIDTTFLKLLGGGMGLVTVWYQETIINTTNPTQLVSRDWSMKQFMINPNNLLVYSMEYSRDQIFVNGKHDKDYYTVTDARLLYTIDITPNESIPLMVIKLDFGKYSYISNVKYTLITDVASSFGGMIGLVLSIFKVINQTISTNFMQISMINEMFKFHYFDNVVEDNEKSKLSTRKFVKVVPNQEIIKCLVSINSKTNRVASEHSANKLIDDIGILELQSKRAKAYKRESFYSCTDLLKIKILTKKDLHLQILQKAYDIYDNSINFSNVLKSEIDSFMIRSFIYDQDLIEHSITPSLNCYSQQSIDLLNKIKSFQTATSIDDATIYQKLKDDIGYKPNIKLIEMLAYSLI